jgi:hypothetical protein
MLEYKPTVRYREKKQNSQAVNMLINYFKSKNIKVETGLFSDGDERVHTIQVLNWVDEMTKNKINELIKYITKQS